MTDPTLLVIVILLAIAGIAGTVILLLMPAREKILNDEPAENDARVSSHWAGADQPYHDTGNVHYLHHDAGHGGGHDGGGAFH